MTTTIYSCGGDLTARGLAVICQGRGWMMFPETYSLDPGDSFITIPRHPSELPELLDGLVGRTFVTVSEHLILLFQQQVRHGHIDPTELNLYCVEKGDFDHDPLPGRRIRIDLEGDLIDNWPGGFFNERLQLLR